LPWHWILALALLAGSFSCGAGRSTANEPKDDADAARQEREEAFQRAVARNQQLQEEMLFRVWEAGMPRNARMRRVVAGAVADADDEAGDGPASRQLAVRFLDYLLVGRRELNLTGEDSDQLRPARSRLELVLRHNMTALELLCGLTVVQQEKLMLAGKKDIARLMERIDEIRRRWRLVSDGDVENRLNDLQLDAHELRTALNGEPCRSGSHFARMLTRTLTEEQTARCRSMGGFDRLTIRVHLLSQRSDADEVGRLRLGGTSFGDADMPRLTRAMSLRGLFLDFTPVTDAGLAPLGALSNLEVLDLGNTSVKGAGLAHLKDLKSLQVLYLGHTRVTDAGLEHLRNLQDLKKVDLQSTLLTGSGLVHLVSLKKLETLLVGGTRIGDAELACVQRLESLKELELDDTAIGDAGLIHLAGLPNLFKLDLRRTRVTDAGLAHLKGSVSLRYLYLYGTSVTNEAVADFQREMPAVKVLK
jgi:hypothetical protein